MSRVKIEVRETGIQAFSATACDGRYGAVGANRDEAILAVQHQIPVDQLEEGEPEIEIVPLPQPDESGLFEDRDGIIRPGRRFRT